MEIVVDQPGYVYIYFSNDNPQPLEVFFDDFTVTHSHSAIVQADDYYPFGMTFNGYRRESSMMNRFLYQGKEMQPEIEIYDFEWRGYDPMINRTWQMAPHAENYYSWTPYSWTFNNPINIIDPDGRDPVDPRTGRQVNLNLYRSSVYSQSSYDPSRHRVSRDATLYSKADPFFTRKRNAPDGLWVGAASFKPVPLLNYTSKDAIAKLGSLYNKSSFAGIDYGAPNDYMWRKVADQGTYAYIDDSFSRTEIFKPSSFNVVGVEENYITSIVNLSAKGKSNYNINSVTTFGIEKGEIQTRTKSSFFGLITTEEQFRTLNVTETTTIYNNNQVTDNITTKEYQIEEIIK